MTESDNCEDHDSKGELLVEFTEQIEKFLVTYNNRMKEDSFVPISYKGIICVDLDDTLDKVKRYNESVATSGKTSLRVDPAKLFSNSCVVHYQMADTHCSEIQKIRKRAQERRYKASVKNMLPYIKSAKQCSEDTFLKDFSSLSTGVNIITGIFLTFLGGYYFFSLIAHFSYESSLILGVLVSFVSLLVEVALMILYDSTLERKRKKQIASISGKSKVIRATQRVSQIDIQMESKNSANYHLTRLTKRSGLISSGPFEKPVNTVKVTSNGSNDKAK